MGIKLNTTYEHVISSPNSHTSGYTFLVIKKKQKLLCVCLSEWKSSFRRKKINYQKIILREAT